MRKLSSVAVNLASISQQSISVGLAGRRLLPLPGGRDVDGRDHRDHHDLGRSLQPVGQLAFLVTRGKQAFATLIRSSR